MMGFAAVKTLPATSPTASAASTAAHPPAMSDAAAVRAKPFCKIELRAADGAGPAETSGAEHDFSWQSPPAEPGVGLTPGAVHLWRTALEGAGDAGVDWEEMLSADERARAGRFKFETDRARFVAARGWLRLVLARYTGVAPHELAFGCGAHGKPHLRCDQAGGGGAVEFNLSHAESFALLAITRGRAIGVDVERVRAVADGAAMAARYFSAREQREWRALPPERQAEAWLKIWVRKEACVKATGGGLDEALSQLEVIGSGGGVGRVTFADAAGGAVSCGLVGFEPVDGYVAAVAVR